MVFIEPSIASENIYETVVKNVRCKLDLYIWSRIFRLVQNTLQVEPFTSHDDLIAEDHDMKRTREHKPSRMGKVDNVFVLDSPLSYAEFVADDDDSATTQAEKCIAHIGVAFEAINNYILKLHMNKVLLTNGSKIFYLSRLCELRVLL